MTFNQLMIHTNWQLRVSKLRYELALCFAVAVVTFCFVVTRWTPLYAPTNPKFPQTPLPPLCAVIRWKLLFLLGSVVCQTYQNKMPGVVAGCCCCCSPTLTLFWLFSLVFCCRFWKTNEIFASQRI